MSSAAGRGLQPPSPHLSPLPGFPLLPPLSSGSCLATPTPADPPDSSVPAYQHPAPCKTLGKRQCPQIKGQPSPLNAPPLCHSLAPLLSRKPHLLSGLTPTWASPWHWPHASATGLQPVSGAVSGTGHAPLHYLTMNPGRQEPGGGLGSSLGAAARAESHSLSLHAPHAPGAPPGFPCCVSERTGGKPFPRAATPGCGVQGRHPSSEPPVLTVRFPVDLWGLL